MPLIGFRNTWDGHKDNRPGLQLFLQLPQASHAPAMIVIDSQITLPVLFCIRLIIRHNALVALGNLLHIALHKMNSPITIK